VIPSTVRRLAQRRQKARRGPVAAAFDALGLFDVYGSWWFMGSSSLLFVSLTGCLIPRWRRSSAPPPPGRRAATSTG
jgi:cytochrome c biogenesis protein